MSNTEDASDRIINADALDHFAIIEPYRDVGARARTQRGRTPAHSHAYTHPHGDAKAIGCRRGEATSRSRLLMATGSRGAGRHVDNDNVTPSQPARKKWDKTRTHSLKGTRAERYTCSSHWRALTRAQALKWESNFLPANWLCVITTVKKQEGHLWLNKWFPFLSSFLHSRLHLYMIFKNIRFKKVYLQLLLQFFFFFLNYQIASFFLSRHFLFLLLSPFASFIASLVTIWSVSQAGSGPPVYYGYLSFETVNFLIPFINSVRCFRAGGILLHNWPLFNNLIRALP